MPKQFRQAFHVVTENELLALHVMPEHNFLSCLMIIMNYLILNSFILACCRLREYILCPFIYIFGVLRRFQHCIGHITTASWKGRGNQYMQFVRVLYCKLPTNGKQVPAFPLEAVPGTEPRPQRWEARVLPLCHRGPLYVHS